MKFNFDDKKNQIAVLTAAVYFVQGALGISAIALPIYFRRQGWTVSEIAIISSVSSLPWVFKIFYGFLSDTVPLGGFRRKPYLFIYLVCSMLGWCLLGWGPGDKQTALIALWIANFGFAGTDVITDGLVVEHSEGAWSHIYQSISWGFRSAGSVLTGLLGGWLMLRMKPQALFLITSILPILALPGLIYLREDRVPAGLSAAECLLNLKKVIRFCFSKSVILFLLFLSTVTSSSLFGTPFFFYMKENLFFGEDYLGFLLSLGWAGAVIGSVIYGRWLKAIPLRNLLFAVVVINAVNILSTFWVKGVLSAAVLTLLGGIAVGVVLLPVMTAAAVMSTGSGVEGTLFAVLMGVFNLTQILWGVLGGKLLHMTGIWVLVGAATVIQIAAWPLVPSLARTLSGNQEPTG